MKFWKLSKFILPVLAFSLLFFSCEKEKVDNSDGDYPIELTVTKPGRNVMLEWTRTNISDFENYTLVRSTEPIEDSPVPTGVFEVIDDLEENTFEDTTFPLSEEVYYKVYVKVGERFLFSPTVAIQFDVNLLDFRVAKAVFDEEMELVFLFDNTVQTVFRYDLATEEVTHELTDQSAFDYIMAVGDAGQDTELYLSQNNSFIIEIYDDKLSLKTSHFATSTVTGMEVGEGVFIVATNDFGESLTIYDRATLNEIEQLNVSSGFDRRIKLLPTDERILVDASFEQVIKYEFDEDWQLTNTDFSNFFGNPLLEIEASPDGEHFIPTLEGTVFNLDLTPVGEVFPGNFSQDYIFSADGSKVYAMNFSPGRLIEFSFPELEELRTIELNYSPMSAFRKKDGSLVIAGIVLDAFPQKTIVDILEL